MGLGKGSGLEADLLVVSERTDNLPDDPADASVVAAGQVALNAGHAALAVEHAALAVQNDNMLAEVLEIERHLHNRERWFGLQDPQTATDWALDTLNPYVAVSGNNEYGGDADDEAFVLGTADTPAIAGMIRFDLHRIFVTGVSVDTVWKLRVIFGNGTMADAITAGQYTEVPVMSDVTNPQQAAGLPFHVIMPKVLCGVDQVWIQAWNATNNAVINFLVGLHEYPV